MNVRETWHEMLQRNVRHINYGFLVLMIAMLPASRTFPIASPFYVGFAFYIAVVVLMLGVIFADLANHNTRLRTELRSTQAELEWERARRQSWLQVLDDAAVRLRRCEARRKDAEEALAELTRGVTVNDDGQAKGRTDGRYDDRYGGIGGGLPSSLGRAPRGLHMPLVPLQDGAVDVVAGRAGVGPASRRERLEQRRDADGQGRSSSAGGEETRGVS